MTWIDWLSWISRLARRKQGLRLAFVCSKLFLLQHLFPRKTPVSVRAFGFYMKGSTFQSLLFLIKEMFFEEQYRVDLPTQQPFIIDAGSNIGISVLYFKKLFPLARIMCFEPQPRAFGFLQQNISANGLKEVTTYQAALGRIHGSVQFFAPGNGTGLMASIFALRETHGVPLEVPARRLSDFITRPVDLLKIDVEGAEGLILLDLIESGKLIANQILLEYHEGLPDPALPLHALLASLSAHGYSYRLAAARTPVGLQQDIFVHAVKHKR